jgi:predicted lipoprotein with Yx(FWY)xxD motif
MRIIAGLGAILVEAVAIIALSQGSMAVAASLGALAPELASPPGVVIQVRGTLGGGGSPGRTMVGRPVAAIAGANGMMLYVSDLDKEPLKSACMGECAAAWPPYIAPSDFKPGGQWSVAVRDDRRKQLTYAGKPLYSSVKDSIPGDAKGDGADKTWHMATFAIPPAGALPAGIAVRAMFNAEGLAFVDEAGKPLYVFDADAKGIPTCVSSECLSQWTPLVAGRLARGVGEFSVIHRDDGIDQWAYKGWPVYTFVGDIAPDDVRGDKTDNSKWHVLLSTRYFMPPAVKVRLTPYGGTYLVNPEGMTLYVRDRYDGQHQGHSLRAGSRGAPPVGRALGTASCDANCTSTWRPFRPTRNAQVGGFWEIVTRQDGTKQWSYDGYPLYLFSEDKKPGEMKGNDKMDLLILANDPFAFVDPTNPQAAPGTMYWHPMSP